jgi:hypothetical protein
MRSKHSLIFLFFIFSTALRLFALTGNDSILKLPKTRYQSEEQFDRQSGIYTIPDSTINNIEQYRNRYNIGNSGLAVTNLYFPLDQRPLGFNYAANNFDSYLFHPQNVDYFNTRTPYTELFLLAGAKNELYTDFIHSQNVNKNLNFTAKFQRIRSDGFYERQNTNHTDFLLSCNYTSSDKKYRLISNAMINSLNNAENGGITSDAAFADGPLENRLLIGTYLADADRRYKSKSFYIKQYLNTGPKKALSDTSSHLQVLPTAVFAHSFLIQQEQIVYSDPSPETSGFYNEFYVDTNRTHDSTAIFRLENELSWRLLNKKSDGTPRKLGMEIGLKQQFVHVSQYAAADTILTTKSIVPNPASLIPLPEQVATNTLSSLSSRNLLSRSFNNFMVNAELYNYDTKSIAYGIRGEYVMAGYNAGDYNLNAIARLYVHGGDTTQFWGYAGNNSERRPDFMYLHYYSNNFIWNNNFNPVYSLNNKLYYRWNRYKLELGVVSYQYKNFVYLNSTGAAQSNSAIQGYSVYLEKNFYIWHFVFKNKITWQYVPDSSVIHLPTWVTEQSLYYESNLFKHALHFQIGVDVFYNSHYYANAYSPELGQFYVQNSTAIGSYPFVDLFLNMKISRARIFIKYENVNSYLGYYSYYYAPHYPGTDAAFKFGVLWKFFD